MNRGEGNSLSLPSDLVDKRSLARGRRHPAVCTVSYPFMLLRNYFIIQVFLLWKKRSICHQKLNVVIVSRVCSLFILFFAFRFYNSCSFQGRKYSAKYTGGLACSAVWKLKANNYLEGGTTIDRRCAECAIHVNMKKLRHNLN